MKKFFIFMAMIIAAVVLTTACNSDDNERTPQELANALTAFNWQGYNQYQYKEGGSWVDRNNDFVVMRFQRNGANAIAGTGVQLQFKRTDFTEFEEKSTFKWEIQGDRLYINYDAAGWGRVSAINNDIEIHGDLCSGYWLTTDGDRRYRFNYRSTTFAGWNNF
jgi:hypothetical protein